MNKLFSLIFVLSLTLSVSVAYCDESTSTEKNSVNAGVLLIVVKDQQKGNQPGIGGDGIESKIYIKGSLARIETTLPNVPQGAFIGSSIMNGETGEMWNINHIQKTYTHLTSANMKETKKILLGNLSQLGMMPGHRPQLVDLEKTQVIDGQKLKAFKSSGNNREMVYWVAQSEQLKDVARAIGKAFSNPISSALMMQFPDPEEIGGGMPLRIEMTMKLPNGIEIQDIQTVESIEWTEVEDGFFSPPEDYSQVDYAGLLQQR